MTLQLSGSHCYEIRRLEVFQDHLERDYQNFLGRYCALPDGAIYSSSSNSPTHFRWTFNHGGKSWRTARGFNCHGSVWHAYNGSRTSTMELPPFSVIWEDSEPVDWNMVSKLAERGDVISYWDKNGVLQHSAMFINNRETFGANNDPLYSAHIRVCACGNCGDIGLVGTGWKWMTCAPQYYFDELNRAYSVPNEIPLLKSIKLHRRP